MDESSGRRTPIRRGGKQDSARPQRRSPARRDEERSACGWIGASNTATTIMSSLVVSIVPVTTELTTQRMWSPTVLTHGTTTKTKWHPSVTAVTPEA
jgi:hypothetical protein